MRLIDADELRKNVLKWMPSDPCGKEEKEFPFETDICVSMIMEIDETPTIVSEQNWILCSERMPDNGRQVLVFARSVHFALAKYDEMREADGTYKKQWVTFDAWKPFYKIKDVIAWMELPELYQGGGDT